MLQAQVFRKSPGSHFPILGADEMSAHEGTLRKFPNLRYVLPQDCNEKYMVSICQARPSVWALKIKREVS